MKASEELLQNLGESTEYARHYAEKQVEYVKLLIAERTAKTASALVTTLAVTFIVLLVIIMLSITLGFFLGSLLKSYPLAFLCVSVLYMIIGGMIYLLRRQFVTNPILTLIIKAMLD
jgi:F0F1-type ATP synthase assembly protein I